jgi:hypothetical protein
MGGAHVRVHDHDRGQRAAGRLDPPRHREIEPATYLASVTPSAGLGQSMPGSWRSTFAVPPQDTNLAYRLRRLCAPVRDVPPGPLTCTDSGAGSTGCAPARGGRRSLGSRVRSRARATSTPRLESGASGSSSFRCRRPVLSGAVPGYSVGDALSAVGGPAEAVGVELELRPDRRFRSWVRPRRGQSVRLWGRVLSQVALALRVTPWCTPIPRGLHVGGPSGPGHEPL